MTVNKSKRRVIYRINFEPTNVVIKLLNVVVSLFVNLLDVCMLSKLYIFLEQTVHYTGERDRFLKIRQEWTDLGIRDAVSFFNFSETPLIIYIHVPQCYLIRNNFLKTPPPPSEKLSLIFRFCFNKQTNMYQHWQYLYLHVCTIVHIHIPIDIRRVY